LILPRSLASTTTPLAEDPAGMMTLPFMRIELVVVAWKGSPAWLILEPSGPANFTETLVPAGTTGGGGGGGGGAGAGAGAGVAAGAGAGAAAWTGAWEGIGDDSGDGAGVGAGCADADWSGGAAGAGVSAAGFDLHPTNAKLSSKTPMDIFVLMVFPLS